MVTFRNNINRRNNFRRHDRNFKSNGDRPKYGSNFSNNENFQRKVPGRNNHNASKLIEKYNDLARDALTSGDKILSENYLQHADHFTRIMNEQDAQRKERFAENKAANDTSSLEKKPIKPDEISKENIVEKIEDENKVKKDVKTQAEVN